jgi:hypothetical protein
MGIGEEESKKSLVCFMGIGIGSYDGKRDGVDGNNSHRSLPMGDLDNLGKVKGSLTHNDINVMLILVQKDA